MSLLTHTCKCGHRDFFHRPKATGGIDCSFGQCRCRGISALTAPELIPTFDNSVPARRIEACIAPGARWGGGIGGHTACACDACKAPYAELGPQ